MKRKGGLFNVFKFQINFQLIKLVEKPTKPEMAPPPPPELPNGDQNGEQLSSAEDGDDWQVSEGCFSR
jgi:hypothetical protein